MSRALAYCGFRHGTEISLPAMGVRSAEIRVIAQGDLRLLWSEVEWPLESNQLQKHAVEFHSVTSHVFQQTAVIPFRLLSVFQDETALQAFVAEHDSIFLEDLERLKNFVQMECVLYPSPSRLQAASSSGAEYLRNKARWMRASEGFAKTVRDAVGHLSRETATRETKNANRIFALVERGRESEFRQTVSAVPIPEHLSRRISGPWPAAEFLSEGVRAPQIAGVK
ncbi:MAG: GvpL/GvpF family gas vesicle protein [Candidatus Angelobacter sp.]